MTCPQCRSTMSARRLGDVTAHRCDSCEGVFLERAELANLIEAENDFHRDTGPKTQPLPRITKEMTAPPPPTRPATRAFVETLFR